MTVKQKRPAALIIFVVSAVWMLIVHAFGPTTETAAAQQPSRFRMESTLSYEHFSRNKVILRGVSFFDVLHIGDFRVERLKRDVFTLSTRASYDVSPLTRLELVVPFRFRRDLEAYERDSTVNENPNLPRTRERHSTGLGDMEFNVYFALPPADIGRTFSIGLKAPTGRSPYGLPENRLALGSGHWAAQIGLQLQKVIDPVVLFGSLGYTHSFGRGVVARNKDNEWEPTWAVPGSSLRYTIGAGLAVNHRVSVTAMLEHLFTRPARLGEEVLKESEANSAVLNLGLRYQWVSGRVMRLQLGIGLTSDAPDFSVSVAIPLFGS